MAKSISTTLAENLKKLAADQKYGLDSQPKIAKKGRIGQRTVGRALKGEVSTTIGSLEGIAHAFGMPAWQLLHPTLGRVPASEGNDPLLFQLIDFWGQLSQEHRDKLVTDANWLHTQENPRPTTANPWGGIQTLGGPPSPEARKRQKEKS